MAPGTVTGCPTWLRVLDEAAGGDKSTVHYLQRLFGYSVVGVVTEHVVAVLGLTGGEGKSLIINTLAGVLGDYAAVAPQDMLTPQQGERHSTDLAGLAGAPAGHRLGDRGRQVLGRGEAEGDQRRRQDHRALHAGR